MLTWLFFLIFSVHAAEETFSREPVKNLCLKGSLQFLESSKEDRSLGVEKIKKLLKSQNAFCPGSFHFAIFAKSNNEKAKLSLYSEMASQALLNLENIAGQVWSEQEFNKNSKEIQKLIDLIADQKAKQKYQKWLEQTLQTEKQLRPQAKRDVLKDCAPASVDKSRLPKNALQHNGKSGVGWCYAYAASQLVGYELGEAVSAPDIALTFNRKNLGNEKYEHSFFDNTLTDESLKYYTNIYNKNSDVQITPDQMKKLMTAPKPDLQVEGGWAAEAIDASLQKGFCLDKDFKSDFGAEGDVPVFSALQKLQALEDTESVLCQKTLSNRVMTRFPGLKTQDLINIFNNPNKTGDIVDLVRDRSCQRIKPKLKVNDVYCQKLPYGGSLATCKSKLYDTIINQLSAGKPVGISFTPKGFNETDGKATGHAIVLTQKKYDPTRKECMFKVRDSNEAIDYWVSEGQLMSRVNRVQYLIQEKSPLKY